MAAPPPLVRSARVMRPGGKPLLIVADGASDEAWAASDARLDGQPVPATALRHTELMRAGELPAEEAATLAALCDSLPMGRMG